MNNIYNYNEFLNENIFYELKNKKWINAIDKILSE